MHLQELQQIAWAIAETKGHHDALRDLPAREATLIRLALVHTEISEATQEIKRHGSNIPTLMAFAHEAVDAIIRLAEAVEDLSQRIGHPVNLDTVLLNVLNANSQRPYKYGTPEEAPPGSIACDEGSISKLMTRKASPIHYTATPAPNDTPEEQR